MYSFTICLLILVVGYFVYGRYVERVFGPEAKRPTEWIISPCRPGRSL